MINHLYITLLLIVGENLNSAASTKIYVLSATEVFVECIADHLSRLYHLQKDTREAIQEHYAKLIKDIKGGFGKNSNQGYNWS